MPKVAVSMEDCEQKDVELSGVKNLKGKSYSKRGRCKGFERFGKTQGFQRQLARLQEWDFKHFPKDDHLHQGFRRNMKVLGS